jgi:osmotically-inducible protein OsmY
MRDADLRQDVQGAFDREAGLGASAIAVAVDDGVVTLRGDVSSQFEKYDAERVALRVRGVNAVANDLMVQSPGGHEPTDTELARAVVDALALNALVPTHSVRVVVANGWVTLSGTLDFEFQRNSADLTVGKVAGVRGLSDTLMLKEPDPSWKSRYAPAA